MKKYINVIIKDIGFLVLDLMKIQGESKNELEIKKIDSFISELEIIEKAVTEDYRDFGISFNNYKIILLMCDSLRKFTTALKESY